MVIVGGSAVRDHSAAQVLTLPPFQFVGRLSYGLYLWHWPVLILAPAALGIAGTAPVNVLLCLGSLGLAWASLTFLENPIRRLVRLRTRPRLGISLGASLSASAALIALIAALVVTPPATYGPPGIDVDLAIAAASDPAGALGRLVAESATRETLPNNLTPALAVAADDRTGFLRRWLSPGRRRRPPAGSLRLRRRQRPDHRCALR